MLSRLAFSPSLFLRHWLPVTRAWVCGRTEGCLLLANALAILSEDVFLAPRGWSFQEYSGVRRNSFKGQLLGLIYATQYLRVLLILLNTLFPPPYPLYLSTTATMASSSSSSILPSLTSTLSSSKPSIPFSFRAFTKTSKRVNNSGQILKAQTLEFSGSFFEGGFGGGNDDEPPTAPWSGISAIEDKEEPQCPPEFAPL
ncbi:hypothetical protein HAX54_008973 [Datura stramonium]|uniref:Uncharacterized protein n=1 Tax=Datura stramonium TaxID=4076 RepID=A0ABS8RXM2_DATST|nr:hypothetical protein [Datura stramonium]